MLNKKGKRISFSCLKDIILASFLREIPNDNNPAIKATIER